MGRMLETLKLGEGRRTPLPVSKAADVAPVQDCVVDWEIGAEVPFVEVGGPNKKVELSPGLLKHPPQPVPQAPHLPVETVPAAKKKVVELTETAPLTAAFEPWPAPTMTTLGISREIVAYHQPEHAASRQYAALLDAMCRGLRADAANVLLLIGLRPEVGACTVLLNLAACAALEQTRVVVVDAGQGDLASKLGHAAHASFLEVIAGTAALEQAIVKTGIDRLHLLPIGATDKNPLTSQAMAWLMAWLRERYELIFIAGPMLEDANLALQVPQADGIYLVLPQGEPAAIARGIAPGIARMGGRLSGLIHTHFEV